MFERPLPRDVALIVVAYCNGPEAREHSFHYKMICQIRALSVRWRDGFTCSFPVYMMYFERMPGVDCIRRDDNAWIYAVWPLYGIIANVERYTRIL